MSAELADRARREKDREGWNSVAEAWRKWWPAFEAENGARIVSDRLVEMAQIEAGHHVLDVATGIGEPATTAARRVGSDGRVVATDFSSHMLDYARERAEELGLTNVSFHETDAETLSVPHSGFDAALCRWGLMLFGDADAALRRIHELLRDGGRLAAAVWAEPARVPFASVPMGVIQKELGLDPPPAGAPGIFSLANTVLLTQKFQNAGFTDVEVTRETVMWEFDSASTFIEFMREIAGPMRRLIAQHPPETQEAIWQKIAEAVAPYEDDGQMRIGGESICVVGRK